MTNPARRAVRAPDAAQPALFPPAVEPRQEAGAVRDALAQALAHPPADDHHAASVVVTVIDTPLGPMIAGAIDGGLCLLEFTDRATVADQARRLQALLKQPLVPGKHPYLAQTTDELARYFEGGGTSFTVPLVFRGTPFEER